MEPIIAAYRLFTVHLDEEFGMDWRILTELRVSDRGIEATATPLPREVYDPADGPFQWIAGGLPGRIVNRNNSGPRGNFGPKLRSAIKRGGSKATLGRDAVHCDVSADLARCGRYAATRSTGGCAVGIPTVIDRAARWCDPFADNSTALRPKQSSA